MPDNLYEIEVVVVERRRYSIRARDREEAEEMALGGYLTAKVTKEPARIDSTVCKRESE